MYKRRSITDYFKSFTKPLPTDATIQQSEPSYAASSPFGPLSAQDQQAHSLLVQSSGNDSAVTPAQGWTSQPTPPQRLGQPTASGHSDVVTNKPAAVSSSQRITRNGEIRILNSDDEMQSDSSSLEDIDDILMKGRSPKSSTPGKRDLTAGVVGAEIGTTRPVRRAKYEAPSAAPRKPPKYSLQALAEQRKAYETLRDDITKTKIITKQKSSDDTYPVGGDRDALQGVLHTCGDHEDMIRLRKAIHRTEALIQDVQWSFFEEASIDFPAATQIPCVNDASLDPLLSEPLRREQTFLSGLVEDYAMREGLSEDMLIWIVNAACSEPRDDLRQAYHNVLSKSSNQIKSSLTIDRLNLLFKQLGASPQALTTDVTVQPRSSPVHILTKQQSKYLTSLIDVVCHLAPTFNPATLIHAISLLCRLSMDSSLAQDRLLQRLLEITLTALLACAPEDPSKSPPTMHFQSLALLVTLYGTTTHHAFRVRLLHNLPLLSAEWLMIRRQLALAWFFEDESYVHPELQHQFSLQDISDRLSASAFALNRITDYALFTSSIQILDFALDDCNPPNSMEPMAPHNEKAFNDAVDALASQLKGMFMQIIDSGASDMRRTEAKEVLEGLQSRLSYSVRTRRPRKENLFGDDVEEHKDEQRILKDWIEKANKKVQNDCTHTIEMTRSD